MFLLNHVALILLLVFWRDHLVQGSHFRGGIFMIRPQPNAGSVNEMEISFHISWRRSSNEGGSCSSSIIQNGNLIGGGSLTCQSGCIGTVGSLTYQCTDFSATENWSYGQNTIHYTFSSSGTVTVGYTGCCWISPFNSDWRLTTTFSMTPRSDTNVINSTPRASTSPVVRLQAGCTHEIVIPVSDPDNDVVKCRFATGSDCFEICNSIPAATIDSSSCTVTYTADQGVGYKAVALTIEDFVPSDLSTPLSKVNLQFLVFVFSSNELCSASPYFESPPTLKQGICVAVDAGDTFTTRITANSNSSSATISEIITISPSGTNKGSLTQIGNTNSYYINITWTPTSVEQGKTHVLCYTAISSTGLTSEQTCIQIDAGILPPQPNSNSLSPANNDLINPSGTTWSIQFTSNVQLPTISSFIKFHDANNDQVVHSIDASTSAEVSLDSLNNTLLITPTYTFPEDEKFYITFEGGIVTSSLGCKPGSEAITDKTFWTFRIKGSSNPVIIDVYPPAESALYFGFEVTATCLATGKPLPTIKWFKDNTVLSVSNEISIHQSNSTTKITSVLTISSLSVSDKGVYKCEGINIFTNGTITVDDALFTIFAISEFVVLNFTGVALSPTALYLSWDVPTVPTIVIQYFVVKCDELDSHREFSLSTVDIYVNINSLHPFYSYNCQIQIAGNDIYPFGKTTVVQTLQAAPSAPPQNPSNIFYANSSTKLNLTWFPPPVDKQNGIIMYYRIIMTELETTVNFEFNSNFTYLCLSNLHPYYSYTFTIAAVTISEGPFSSDYTVLMPEDAPTAPPMNVIITALGPRSVQLVWSPPPLEHRNGIIRMYEVLLIGEDDIKHIDTTHHTSITVTYLHPNYKYNVTVVAITILKGERTIVIHFKTHEDVPSQAPGMFNATATSPYSATLTWEPPPHDKQNGIIIEYVIRVSILENNETINLYSTNTYLVVNTLRPYRTYVCVIAARTAIGTGPFGNQFILESPQDAPSGSPSLSSSSQSLVVTSKGFSIDWDPPSYEEQNGVIQYYVIRITELETGNVYQYTRYTTHITLFTLHPAYTYLFQVAAYTVGLGPYSEYFNITLAEDVPSGSPNIFSGFSSTSSSIALSWDPPTTDQQNGAIISYFIVVSKLNTNVTHHYTAYRTHFTVPNLIPFSTYSCKIAAQTAIGTGPFTTSITIITLEDAPNVSPIITAGYSIDSSTVAIQWTPPPPEDHNGIIREYRVLITNVNTGENETRVFSSNTGIIGMLTPSYVYKLSVTAVTVAEGPYSTSITITLPEDIPSGYPKSVQGTSTTPDGIFLSWLPPADDEQNGLIVQYIVNVTHADTLDTMQYFTTKTFIHISGLDPYTTYVCVVAAETSVGIGPFSNLFFIQTIEDVPDSAPLHASGISLGPSSIHITWDPPAVEDHNGVIREYRVNVTQIATQYYTQLVTNQTQIIIENLKPYHVYHCYVSAITIDEGPYTTAFTVLTDEAAPITSPQLLSVTTIDSVSISVTWSIPQPISDHNGIIRSYSIKVTAIGDINSEAFLFSSQSPSFNTSVLSPFTTYSVQVAAVTVETGPFTTSYRVTTQEDVPSSSPQQFNSTTQSPTTVHLSWLPPHPSDVNGIIQYYSLTYFEIETKTLFLKNITSIFTIVGELHPFYTYQFTVTAVTIGAGPKTLIIIRMPESAPSVAPVGTIAKNISSSRVHLSWDELPAENRNGIVRHYQVNVTETNTGKEFELIAYSNELIVQDLHPYYTYNVTVAAHTVDIGSYSAVISYQMEEDVPTSSPKDLSVIVLNSVDVQISWNPPSLSEQNGIISSYFLSVTDSETEVAFTPLITNMMSTTFGGLVPYTTYYCTVAAYTSVGSGPFASFVSFETDEAAPSSSPKEVRITNISSTNIMIIWAEPFKNQINGIIRKYVLKLAEVKTNTIRFINESTAQTEIIVSSLHPYYQYEVSVAAVTIATGPFSTPLSVTTNEAGKTDQCMTILPLNYTDFPLSSYSSAPTSLIVFIISSTSLNASWNDPPPYNINGIIDYYNVKVQVSETTETVHYEAPTKHLLLTDLHPYYTYTVFVAAVTITEGPFSAASSVRTPADVPSGPPLNVTGSVISSSIIEVSWDPPNDLLQNGPIQSYTIIVFEIDTNKTTQEHRDFLHNSIVLTDLHPNYKYHISVAAFTIDLGPLSSAFTITMPESEPNLPPSGLIAIFNQQNVTLHVSWISPPADGINGVLLGYQITCNSLNSHQLSVNVSTISVSLHPLQPETHYTCSVCAYTVIGCGPVETVHVSTYNGSLVGPPSSVVASSVGTTNIYLHWNPPLDLNNVILGYGITYQLLETSFPIETPRPPVTIPSLSTATNYSIQFLLANTVYRIVVFAVFEEGTGPTSEETIVKTIEQDEYSVTSYECLSVSSDSLLCSWDHPVLPDDYYIAGYQISYRLADGFDYYPGYGTVLNRISLSSMIDQYTVIGLRPYTGYIVVLECIMLHGEFAMDNITSTFSLANVTQPSVAEKSVKEFSLVVTSPSSVDVSWKPPPRVSWNGQIVSYNISFERRSAITGDDNRKKRQMSDFSVISSVMVSPKANHYDPSLAVEPLKTESYSLENLEENFEYHFSVIIINTRGAGTPTNPIAQTMPESVPSGPPINITAANVSTSFIILQWMPPTPIDANGIIVLYSLNFTRIKIKETVLQQFSSNQLSFEKQGLHVFETIGVSMAAKTSVGWGPYSNVLYFNTLEDSPSGPVDLIGTLSSDNTVFLTWKTPSTPNGIILGYQIIYSGSQTSVSEGPIKQYASAQGNNNVTIFNLAQDHLYHFKVRAQNGAGYGENSTVAVLIPASDIDSRNQDNIIVRFGVTTTATVVSLIVLVLLIVGFVLIVKQRSGRRKKVKINDKLDSRSGTMELFIPTQSVLLDHYTSKTEDNYYEYNSFKVDELPNLKKQSYNEADSTGEDNEESDDRIVDDDDAENKADE